ncbi:hypothetical protein FB03_05780 [Actinotignum schaalii]|nr:hypothetical protein FB03_05780 [Actinotignum schaalii]
MPLVPVWAPPLLVAVAVPEVREVPARAVAEGRALLAVRPAQVDSAATAAQLDLLPPPVGEEARARASARGLRNPAVPGNREVLAILHQLAEREARDQPVVVELAARPDLVRVPPARVA